MLGIKKKKRTDLASSGIKYVSEQAFVTRLRTFEKHANKTMTLTQIELSSECALKIVEAKANAAIVKIQAHQWSKTIEKRAFLLKLYLERLFKTFVGRYFQ